MIIGKILKVSLLMSFFSLVSSCTSAHYYDTQGIIDHAICVNTHMGYQSYDYPYRKNMCKSIGNLGIGMVRDYVFINSTNTFEGTDSVMSDRAIMFDNVLANIQCYAPQTQVLGVLHDMSWEIDKDVPFSRFYDLVRQAVKRYDGKTQFVPSDIQKKMSFEIKYWEVCNEFDNQIYGKPPFENIRATFDFFKNVYFAIKESNPSAQVVFPGVAHVDGKFLKDIFEYKDTDGKRIWDYFDVFNFHVYPSIPDKLIPIIDDVKEYKRVYGWNKPIWLTEIGWSEFYTDENDIAINLPQIYLMAFACGVNKVFQFQYRRFDFNTGVDASFGLIRSSLDGTYISMKSGEESLSNGTGYNHILIKSPTLQIPLIRQSNTTVAKKLLGKLKNRGLTINGNDFVIDKVSIVRGGKLNDEVTVVNNETSDIIEVPSSCFNDCNIDDVIKLSFSDYKKEQKWRKEDKTMSYFSMKELVKKMTDGASFFSLNKEDDVYICKWIDSDGTGKMAIWCSKREKIFLDNTKKIIGTDYLGKKVIIDRQGFFLDNRIVYLNGHYNLRKE